LAITEKVVPKLRKFGQKRHIIDILFTLGLFCVLAASALMVVVIGSNVYRAMVARADENFLSGVPLAYVANKIRQNDRLGEIFIDKLEGAPALLIKRDLGGGHSFDIWIYHHDGALKEVAALNHTIITRELGRPIIEIDDFKMEQIGTGLWRFTSVDKNGKESSMIIGARTVQDEGSFYASY
jgi:hypothetical protein